MYMYNIHVYNACTHVYTCTLYNSNISIDPVNCMCAPV